MSHRTLFLCSEDENVACDDCEWNGKGADMEMIGDFEERVYAGEICPAGECPECGALVYLVKDAQS